MPIILTKDNVVFLQAFQKDLQKLDAYERNLVLQQIGTTLHTPSKQNIKQLKSYPLARYRLKLGDFRALFNFDSIHQSYVFIALKKRKFLY